MTHARGIFPCMGVRTLVVAAVLFSSAARGGEKGSDGHTGSGVSEQQTALAYFTESDCPLGGILVMKQMLKSGKFPYSERTLAQFYAVTGDEIGTSALYEAGAVRNVEPMTDTTDYHAGSAIAAIVEAARYRRIVIINEDHHTPRHRAFGLLLARALRKAGFSHFGAETFTPALADSMRDGAPDLKMGIYTVEPLYADLARQTAAIGYTLFDYEIRHDQEPPSDANSMQQIASREQAQADNIKRILDGDPHARLFIYTGGGHGSEISADDGSTWMALRLKRDTGLDPLTVDQTGGTPRSSAKFDGPRYRGALASHPGSEPLVLVDQSGQWLTRPGFDLTVFHPRVSDLMGRPGWLAMAGYRRPFPVKVKRRSARTLLRAFKADEPAGSVVMDQVLVPPGMDSVALMLPPGSYRLTRQSEQCETLPVEPTLIEVTESGDMDT